MFAVVFPDRAPIEPRQSPYWCLCAFYGLEGFGNVRELRHSIRIDFATAGARLISIMICKIIGKTKDIHKKQLRNVRPALGHLYGKIMEIMSFKAPGSYFRPSFNSFSICLWGSLKLLIPMIS